MLGGGRQGGGLVWQGRKGGARLQWCGGRAVRGGACRGASVELTRAAWLEWQGRRGRSGTPLARAPSSIRAGLGEKCVLSDLCGVCVVAMATARAEVSAQ
ncbi:hypothetical protein E2C01_010954 [Portunus trituberculatus]|uniref:Uncharacterized protein n=1 Tax=Portunus trituberculatus TaxID=210409 RepID=A0A5B7D9U9_PORTR|nr:hypothetical protein [Portunus trituberculatus]